MNEEEAVTTAPSDISAPLPATSQCSPPAPSHSRLCPVADLDPASHARLPCAHGQHMPPPVVVNTYSHSEFSNLNCKRQSHLEFPIRTHMSTVDACAPSGIGRVATWPAGGIDRERENELNPHQLLYLGSHRQMARDSACISWPPAIRCRRTLVRGSAVAEAAAWRADEADAERMESTATVVRRRLRARRLAREVAAWWHCELVSSWSWSSRSEEATLPVALPECFAASCVSLAPVDPCSRAP